MGNRTGGNEEPNCDDSNRRIRRKLDLPWARSTRRDTLRSGSKRGWKRVQEVLQVTWDRKRHTTPYYPQCDGMAERNIGTVKQVISCILMERKLPKGLWPSLLTEVSFYMNAMENTTTRMSPQMLTYGREPKAPADA